MKLFYLYFSAHVAVTYATDKEGAFKKIKKYLKKDDQLWRYYQLQEITIDQVNESDTPIFVQYDT